MVWKGTVTMKSCYWYWVSNYPKAEKVLGCVTEIHLRTICYRVTMHATYLIEK